MAGKSISLKKKVVLVGIELAAYVFALVYVSFDLYWLGFAHFFFYLHLILIGIDGLLVSFVVVLIGSFAHLMREVLHVPISKA